MEVFFCEGVKVFFCEDAICEEVRKQNNKLTKQRNNKITN
ncbi:hypothetical protein MPR_1959 [Myroides profundi]|nr:hypothetical protein MPR_1959 [Myroides profundi]